MDKIFDYIHYNESDKFAYGICQLTNEANFWWESVKWTLNPEQLHDFTWEDLKDVLYEKYIQYVKI